MPQTPLRELSQTLHSWWETQGRGLASLHVRTPPLISTFGFEVGRSGFMRRAPRQIPGYASV